MKQRQPGLATSQQGFAEGVLNHRGQGCPGIRGNALQFRVQAVIDGESSYACMKTYTPD